MCPQYPNKDLVIPKNIRLIPQPAYRPELGSGSIEDAVASELVAASFSGDQGPQALLPQDIEKMQFVL